jgi:hypothetical protein
MEGGVARHRVARSQAVCCPRSYPDRLKDTDQQQDQDSPRHTKARAEMAAAAATGCKDAGASQGMLAALSSEHEDKDQPRWCGENKNEKEASR